MCQASKNLILGTPIQSNPDRVQTIESDPGIAKVIFYIGKNNDVKYITVLRWASRKHATNDKARNRIKSLRYTSVNPIYL